MPSRICARRGDWEPRRSGVEEERPTKVMAPGHTTRARIVRRAVNWYPPRVRSSHPRPPTTEGNEKVPLRALARGTSTFLAVGLLANPALSQSIEGFAANQVNLPSRTSAFALLEAAQPMETAFSSGARLSFLDNPMSFSLAAPSPTPTDVDVVGALLLAEVGASLRVISAFELGVALPAHLYQSGNGSTAVTGSDNFHRTVLGEARLNVAYGWKFGDFAARPFVIVHLPTGSPSSWSGESSVHAELGSAISFDRDGWELAFDGRAHLRTTHTAGYFRYGSLLRLAIGVRYQFATQQSIGLEAYFSPLLTEQAGPPLGMSTRPLPAEVLANYRLSIEGWSLLVGIGAGLPLSKTSSQAGDASSALAPTTPALRALLDARYDF